MKKIFLLLTFAIVAQMAFPTVYSVKTIPDTKTTCKDCYVTNPDGILSGVCVAKINQLLTDLELNTTAEVAVVVVDSIDIDDEFLFALKLFNDRGYGKASKNNGLLFLHVKSLRAVKIETGYGLEGVLPDATCGKILTDGVYPAFKEDDFDQGVLYAVQKIYDILMSDEARMEIFAQEIADKNWGSNALCNYIMISLVVLILLTLRMNKRIKKNAGDRVKLYEALGSDYRKSWFWCLVFLPIFPFIFYVRAVRKRQRRAPLNCKKCGKPMRLLSKKEKDAWLNTSKQAEEKVKSIFYDVWLCDDCQHAKFFTYPERFTSYTFCPECGAKTYKVVQRVEVKAATTYRTGEGIRKYKCKHCGYGKEEPYIIPKITVDSSSGGSGGGSSRSRGGGGSWGGGRSGGGGAGGRY